MTRETDTCGAWPRPRRELGQLPRSQGLQSCPVTETGGSVLSGDAWAPGLSEVSGFRPRTLQMLGEPAGCKGSPAVVISVRPARWRQPPPAAARCAPLNAPVPCRRQASPTAQSQRIARRAGDTGSILGSGRSPGGGNGNLLMENPMHRGAWRATVHGVTKSRKRLNNPAQV